MQILRSDEGQQVSIKAVAVRQVGQMGQVGRVAVHAEPTRVSGWQSVARRSPGSEHVVVAVQHHCGK